MRDRGHILIGMERTVESDSMEAGTGEEQREEERESDGGGSREGDTDKESRTTDGGREAEI